MQEAEDSLTTPEEWTRLIDRAAREYHAVHKDTEKTWEGITGIIAQYVQRCQQEALEWKGMERWARMADRKPDADAPVVLRLPRQTRYVVACLHQDGTWFDEIREEPLDVTRYTLCATEAAVGSLGSLEARIEWLPIPPGYDRQEDEESPGKTLMEVFRVAPPTREVKRVQEYPEAGHKGWLRYGTEDAWKARHSGDPKDCAACIEPGVTVPDTTPYVEVGRGADLRKMLEAVSYPGHEFRVGTMDDGHYLQIVYNEACIETGVPTEQHGRKWYVSQHATRSEVIQTALKAALTSAEHRVREHFRYQGELVFGPHFDLGELVKLCQQNKTERRPPRKG